MFINHTYFLCFWLYCSRLFYAILPCALLIMLIFSQLFAHSQDVDVQDSTPKQEIIKSTSSLESSLNSIFLDSKNIFIENKYVFLIFIRDDCYYCQILETSIVENPSINGYLSINFSSYLINISSDIKHNIPYLKLSGVSSIDMAKLYGVTALPYIVFIGLDSEEIIRVVGFPGERRLMRVLEFVNNDFWRRSNTQAERIESFLKYEEDYSLK